MTALDRETIDEAIELIEKELRVIKNIVNNDREENKHGGTSHHRCPYSGDILPIGY